MNYQTPSAQEVEQARHNQRHGYHLDSARKVYEIYNPRTPEERHFSFAKYHLVGMHCAIVGPLPEQQQRKG